MPLGEWYEDEIFLRCFVNVIDETIFFSVLENSISSIGETKKINRKFISLTFYGANWLKSIEHLHQCFLISDSLIIYFGMEVVKNHIYDQGCANNLVIHNQINNHTVPFFKAHSNLCKIQSSPFNTKNGKPVYHWFRFGFTPNQNARKIALFLKT